MIDLDLVWAIAFAFTKPYLPKALLLAVVYALLEFESNGVYSQKEQPF